MARRPSAGPHGRWRGVCSPASPRERIAVQINSLLQGYQDPLGLGKRLENAATGAKAAVRALARAALPGGSNQAAAEIASQYDVTNISPQQYSEMIQKLHDAGTLNDQDFRNLAHLRVQLDAAGVKGGTPVNLLQFCSGKLNEMQQKLQTANQATEPDLSAIGGLQHAAASTAQRLDWLEKLSLLHNTPGFSGVDATA
jgi:hypothetical protein